MRGFLECCTVVYYVKYSMIIVLKVQKMDEKSILPLQSPQDISRQWLEMMLSYDLGHSVKITEWTVKSPKAKDGFMSEIGFVRITYIPNAERVKCPRTERRNGKSVSLVVKCMPKEPRRVELMRNGDLGRREVEFYNYSRSGGISTFCKKSGLLLPVPKVFWTGLKDEELTIVLEDLSTRNLRVKTAPEGNTVEQLKCTLKSIAIVHAAGLATISHHGQHILDIPWDPNSVIEFVKSGINLQIKMFAGSRMAGTLEALLAQVKELVNVACRYPPLLNTLIHGDLWTGNVMMNQGDTSASIIDWQFSMVGNPVCDIVTLVFMSGKPSAYQQHLTHILECYWYNFEQAMKKNNVPVSITFGQLKRNVEDMCIYGYMLVTASLESHLASKKITENRMKHIINFMHEKGHFAKFLCL